MLSGALRGDERIVPAPFPICQAGRRDVSRRDGECTHIPTRSESGYHPMQVIDSGGRKTIYRKTKSHRLPILVIAIYRWRECAHRIVLYTGIAGLGAVDTKGKTPGIGWCVATDLQVIGTKRVDLGYGQTGRIADTTHT